jgi:hypothetical protein
MLSQTGIEINYNSNFASPGYSPFNGQYFYSNRYLQSNMPRFTAFFSAKVSRFKVYVAADELFQAAGGLNTFMKLNYQPNLFTRALSIFEQSNRVLLPGYAAPNAMIRLGFKWEMIN